ncbi:hypothetical protein CONPUDRAFT_155817 [Coniophora puteana RWD-64-598 SS2]|uniref:Uncharacterized protein n=1 Tax=Coniophora puteana (strain RWD-64-598) TaxID=741705 RepID=A0A5M3MJG8_CONPW|nr:uncharacterized protein CONPUDRAFT_155817 [Coniophora puteana RWD-64-598 SS2]EIW79137.1 hypothetical protein CONPUDRAFT_155817 [Coniophora puteana RWD-64-598 SS2]
MDNFIVYLCVCYVCWVVHHPSTLSDLTSSACTVENCPGTIYKEKWLANRKLKCTPVKIIPYVPLEFAIQCLLLYPGKWEELQHWRQPGNEPGAVPPVTDTGFDAFPDLLQPMTNIYNGCLEWLGTSPLGPLSLVSDALLCLPGPLHSLPVLCPFHLLYPSCLLYLVLCLPRLVPAHIQVQGQLHQSPLHQAQALQALYHGSVALLQGLGHFWAL